MKSNTKVAKSKKKLVATTRLDRLLKMFAPDPTHPLTVLMIRVLLRVVVVLHFLVERFRTARPLLVVVGPPGTNKTSLARTVGIAVNGTSFNVVTVPTSERDFWPVVASGHPVVFDNAENPPKWLADALATATSGVANKARALYTDSETIELRARGFIWVTTFSAGLRGDLLDRSIIIRLERPNQFIPEAEFWADFDAAIPDIKRECDAVVAEVHLRLAAGERLQPAQGTGRLADFAALGGLVAEVTGGRRDAALFDAAMRAMQVERSRVAMDGDPILALLFAFAESPSNIDEKTQKPGRWLSASALIEVLALGVGGVENDFKHTRMDAQRLGKFLADLIKSVNGLLRVEQRTVNGIRQYRITVL
jgi:hypothetical protein